MFNDKINNFYNKFQVPIKTIKLLAKKKKKTCTIKFINEKRKPRKK